MPRFHPDKIRVWRSQGFTLTFWDLNQRDSYSKATLAYQLTDHGQVLFTGRDFHHSPCHPIDSDAAVAALLSFLSLQEGDTDAEYFDSYTPAQITFRDSDRCAKLQMIALDLEESLAP